MTKKYLFRQITKEEEEEMEEMLLEEIETQAWYTIGLIGMWDAEIVIPLN